MDRYQNLLERIHQGATIIIDGGTGTEVERRGVPQLEDAWNGGAALSHPDILRGVHADYIRAGAEIIISNTFATNRHAMRDAGESANFEAYNRRGVELAIEAREETGIDSTLVAGGISYWSWTNKHPTLEAWTESVAEQAHIMKDAGADLIMLEMIIDTKRMLATLQGVQRAGLPVWVGLTCGMTDQKSLADEVEPTLRNGDLLGDALNELAEHKVDVINIMHTDVNLIDRCLAAVRENWAKPYGVYAHSGGYVEHEWVFTDVIDAKDYNEASQRWLASGAQIIGGCCGIGPHHIYHLSHQV